MPDARLITTFLVLLVSFPAATVEPSTKSLPQNQVDSQGSKESLAGSVRLIETKLESEKVFQHDIVARGVCAVILR